jgi:hypothetical protein
VQASFSNVYAQLTHKGQSTRVSLQIFLIMVKVPKKVKRVEKIIDTNKWSQKVSKHLFGQTKEKFVLNLGSRYT